MSRSGGYTRVGAIDQLDSKSRKCLFSSLINDVVLPQRRRLLAYRDLTWQSAFVDDDGYLAEMIASIVTGVPGTTRRGVSRSTGDLKDGTEVKKGHRVDPNIDFIVRGRMDRSTNSIELGALPPELNLHDIRRQMNANASTVQVVGTDGIRQDIGLAPLGRTASRDALVISSGGARVRLSSLSSERLPGVSHHQSVFICIRQERGHINFGRRTAKELSSILSQHPVMVFYQHDPRGRYSVAVVRSQQTGRELRDLVRTVYGTDAHLRRQVQPYLFPDNVRERLYRSATASVAFAMGASLLAYGVESATGFNVVHWDPDGAVRVANREPMLTEWVPADECPSFSHSRMATDWGNVTDRRTLARLFYRDCMQGHYQSLADFCELTATTRNLGFGNLSQHLVSLVTGLRGTRSGARGGDLVESNGTLSEVKLATGQRGGDGMATEDSPRLTLGWDSDKMMAWRRLFAVRIVDEGTGLGVLVHAPTADLMARFREQVPAYFAGRINNGSGGLQYHAVDPYPHDSYGPQGRRLEFVRVAEFAPGDVASYPEAVPEV